MQLQNLQVEAKKAITNIGDLLTVYAGGSLAQISLSQINEGLETLALVLTIAGIIWRMLKRKKV